MRIVAMFCSGDGHVQNFVSATWYGSDNISGPLLPLSGL